MYLTTANSFTPGKIVVFSVQRITHKLKDYSCGGFSEFME